MEGAGAAPAPAFTDTVTDYARAGQWVKVQRALDVGFPVSAAQSRSRSTLLHYAPDAAAVVDLLRRGAVLDAQDSSGGTPLLNAVMRGNVEVVTALLSAGATPVLAGRTTPLFAAAVYTQPLSAAEHCVRALLAVPDTPLDVPFKGLAAETRARGMPHRAFLADLIGEEAAARRRWSLMRAAWITAVMRITGATAL